LRQHYNVFVLLVMH